MLPAHDLSLEWFHSSETRSGVLRAKFVGSPTNEADKQATGNKS
jgi:hypothetical protein